MEDALYSLVGAKNRVTGALEQLFISRLRVGSCNKDTWDTEQLELLGYPGHIGTRTCRSSIFSQWENPRYGAARIPI